MQERALWIVTAGVLSSCSDSPGENRFGDDAASDTPVDQTGPDAPIDQVAPDALADQADAKFLSNRFFFGYFVRSQEALEVTHANWNLLLVSWGDNLEPVAQSYADRGMTVTISTHSILFPTLVLAPTYEADFARLRTLIEPFERRGLVHSIYVVDEPYWNNIPAADVDRGITYVESFGYKTMIAEWYARAIDSPRPAVDYYGVTCYTFPGGTGVSQDECEAAYRSHPDWNFVLGQATDFGAGFTDQMRWYNLAIEPGREGLAWWVWRWPEQMGAADAPAILSAHAAMDLSP